MHHPYPKRAGFTLVELSISLLILSILITGFLSVITQDIRINKANELAGKLNTIEAALIKFRRAHDRLPCPANGTALSGTATFATEDSTPGSCGGANFTSGNTVAGVVPAKSLDLPDEYMFDPWGGRFTYSVDKRATGNAAFTTYPPTDTTIGSMTVKDGSTGNRTTHAVLVIVSHGPNGHGAFQLSGARKSSASVGTDELSNCHCAHDGGDATFDSTFVMQPAVAQVNFTGIFDDTVRYYERSYFLSAIEATKF